MSRGVWAALIVTGALLALPALASAATTPLAIHIVGNHFVNGSGQTIRLLGVDRPGTEYACSGGWGYSDGDAATDANAIAAWHADAVRIPINEDCWLGINGEPAYRPGADTEAQSQAAYQQTIETYVSELNAAGIYAILDLHWSAPGLDISDGQRPMPDDHSASFWTSVATTFASNPAVVFDAFNEPFSPADVWADAASYPVDWGCWRSGSCTVTAGDDIIDPGLDAQTYTAVGMQALVDAIRGAGAAQPILLGGLSYANDLTGWLANEPTDPGPDGVPSQYPQLAASFHNYEGETYDTPALWDAAIAPVAAQVPVVTGEFDENECTAGQPVDDGWDQTFMNWADAHGVSYLAWGWFTGVTPDCDNYYLINADGAPSAPNGVALDDHLTALWEAASKPPTVQCVVPKLAGTTLPVATKRLKAAHCNRGSVTRPKTKRRDPKFVVASSSPPAGRHKKEGSKVALKLRVRV